MSSPFILLSKIPLYWINLILKIEGAQQTWHNRITNSSKCCDLCWIARHFCQCLVIRAQKVIVALANRIIPTKGGHTWL
jgi:hypothetical protein